MRRVRRRSFLLAVLSRPRNPGSPPLPQRSGDRSKRRIECPQIPAWFGIEPLSPVNKKLAFAGVFPAGGTESGVWKKCAPGERRSHLPGQSARGPTFLQEHGENEFWRPETPESP